jgi:16S rRNA (guanine1207-N2)-methyltransferase
VPAFSFDALRRRPDIEAPNLYAVDAADRLILDEAARALSRSAAGEVAVIGDGHGALTLGAIALHRARDVRVFQDPLVAERALDANAAELGLAGFRHCDGDGDSGLPGADTLAGARVVLLKLPKSLDALAAYAAAIARHAAPDVVVYAGGMVKHMSLAMNSVLADAVGPVTVSLARQKARVLTATAAATSAHLAAEGETAAARAWDRDAGLWVCAYGGAFAGARLDIGTRFLLGVLGDAKPDAASALDLGCGTGALAAALAVGRPGLRVTATDQSAAAVASARATASANGVADRVRVVRADAGDALQDGSFDLIVLNPPFHAGTSVHAAAGLKLIEAAGRLLAPDGELWTVFNSHLGYQPALRGSIGVTRQIARNSKFTVTASTRR